MRRRANSARWTFPTLVAALAAGLALLFPAVSLAAGGRVAPADPLFVDYIHAVRAGRSARALGLVPAPVSRSGVPRAHFAPLMARFPERFAPQGTSVIAGAAAPSGAVAEAEQAATPPTAFDLRDAGKLSPIRDQGNYGTCWAFASLASLESSLLPGQASDYSENNLAHRAGFSLDFDDGGNSYMAAAYLLRWAGPVSEADDPYAPYAATPNPPAAGAAVRAHVHEVLELPTRTSSTDTANLKWAVMTYGAVFTSMYWTGSAYRASTASYYYAGSGTNHAVACVGWDDSYAASNFASAPPGPGAFLVRNSWGTGFGRSGYFWVSYHDTTFAGQSAVFAGAEPAGAAERILQHDPLGWVSSYRPPGATDPSTAWFAASYTAEEAGTLTATGFYATAPNATYEVRVAGAVGDIRGAPVLASGTLAVPGYHTVALATPVALAAGQKLAIAVRVTVPGYRFPIAIERPYTGYADATAGAGQSYVSGDGATWTDLTTLIAGTDVCLKGYASATASGPGAIPSPDPSASPAPDPSSVAPRVRLRGAATRHGAVVGIACRVEHSGPAASADVRLTVRNGRGAVVRRATLRDVNLGARHVWRLRAPRRPGAYAVVAVATLDTGEVSKRATATMRVR